QRCRSVVVIAHSQGAYVAEQVREGRDDIGTGKIHSYVTLGSGVQTLAAIENIARNPKVNFAGWMSIGCMLALVVAGAIALAGAVCTVAGVRPLVVAAAIALAGALPTAAVIGTLALGAFVVAAERARNAHEGRRIVLPAWALLRDWFDFFASKDLVPYGRLIDPENKLKQRYHDKEVRNRDSSLGDHVLYWQNFEQVVGPLARQVGSAAGFKPLTDLLPDDDAVFARLDRARLARLGYLRIAPAGAAGVTRL